MDEDRPSQPTAGTPSDESFRSHDAQAGPGGDNDGYEPGLSRKVVFGVLGLLVVIFALGSAWMGYQYASTSAIAKLGKSVAVPVPGGAGPTEVAPTRAPAPAPAPVPAAAAGPAEPASAVTAGPSAPPTLPSAEELLADKKRQPAPQGPPAALMRDLPDWLATEVSGGRTPRAAAQAAASAPVTAGSSADESAELAARTSAKPSTRPGRRGEAQERAAAVFARCPKPGESGAVECRRAVCSGAARKQGACSAYLN
ncbi:hypothetical protein ACFFTM_02605 [Pseudoduganella plicata]|uniref:Uncharacterized protein n=1 Tax=Pseudoduganella plicata TaxID=321984 RepID=A0A4P7BAN6_9BURK|nr:hypothetical protein [Pseudoduganella plicata]QBQ35170.1 hypothetical protein E1742_02555 [Pseudoduganella plicata]GGZ05303.1 hypothetical protein GCM10007388_43720 [Pseudoduganella plicata]